ncbi:MAG: hypothetical protein AAF892_16340 [Cyanobacteria bacterium P01_D01_bin.71]
MSAAMPPDWNLQPGFLSEGDSDFEAGHIFLGRFLQDRHSPDPLSDRSILQKDETFEWGQGRPLEKVVNSVADFQFLMQNPQLYRNAIAIIEPWVHVGRNPFGEEVRASLNVAYLAQKLADLDSILFPMWSTGLFELDKLIAVLSAGVAIVMEGGNPSVRDAATFEESKASLDDLQTLTQRILLARSPTSAPAIFICLGHQLAAQAHIRLIQQAVEQIQTLEELKFDPSGSALKALKQVSVRIRNMGQTLKVKKHKGLTIAEDWSHPEFAVGSNEHQEVGNSTLYFYRPPDIATTHVPEDLILAHEVTHHEFEGVIDTSIQYESELNISMFHTDEVNEEAILFANWAYRLLHDVVIPYRHVITDSPISWLNKLPYAVKILCSTATNDEIVTECAATCIYYKDYETGILRRSFSSQFHPELLSDLRVVGQRKPPSYAELKIDHGARLFARLLYAGMQE